MPGSVQPRKFTREDCLEFITKHPELWGEPRELVRIMRERSILSSLTPAWEQAAFVMQAITPLLIKSSKWANEVDTVDHHP